MSGNDSAMFFEQLAALSRLEPTQDACREALEGTRAEILKAAARRRKRRLWMRMTIPSGMAAVVAAALVVTFLPGSQKASAADQLEQAVQTTKAFKGWTHWTQVFEGAATIPATGPAMHLKKATRHANGAEGIMAEVTDLDNDIEIDMWWIARRETATYNQKTGEIRFRTMSDEESKELEKMAAPMTVADIVSDLKAHLGRDPVSIKETPEGEGVRFDIVLFASTEEAEKFRESKHQRASIGTGLSVWVNRDKLITRLRMEPPSGEARKQGAAIIEVTYGPPEIKDIYDLGAPRTAKVVDQRIGDLTKQGAGSDLAKLAARLDDRRVKGFGDGVALLSTYISDSTGRSVNTSSGNVTLYAVQGNKMLANQYLLFLDRSPADVVSVLKAAPAAWPALDAANLLPTLRTALPEGYCIVKGDHGWYGSLGTKNVLSMKSLSTETDREFIGIQTLGSSLWPRRELSGLVIANVDAKMQDDLLRLRHKGMTTLRDGGRGDFETTYLLDPAKDDLPTQWYRNTVKPESGEVVERLATHNLKFARLSDGQWYPTDWTSETIQRDPATGNDNGFVMVSHLQIFPAMKIDEGWFSDPRGYVTTGPAK